MIREKIIQTETFKNAVKAIYALVDADHDGQIDREELILAIAQLHVKVAEKFPGVTTPPSKALIDKTLAACDLDKSGTLSHEEFEMFATKWFESQSVSFITRLVASSAVFMVVLPASASIVHESLPLKFIPKILFKVIFGMAFKVAAVALKARSDDKGDDSDNTDQNTDATNTSTTVEPS